MLAKIERPFREEERQCLLRTLDSKPVVARSDAIRWFSLWAGILVLCLALFAAGTGQLNGSSGIWMVIVPIASILGLLSFYFAWIVAAGYFRWTRHQRRFQQQQGPMIQAALEDGRARVTRVESDHAIVIQEFEDEGSAYIFELGDGTCLYLRGQFMFPETEGSPWPAKQFEIVRSALNAWYLGIFSAEGVVEHLTEVEMEDMPREFVWGDAPESETILTGNAEEVLASLGYKKTVKKRLEV